MKTIQAKFKATGLATVLIFVLAACASDSKKTADPTARGASVVPSTPGAERKAGFVLRPFFEKTLPNGLRLLFIEDKNLPYISYYLMFKTGSTSDPIGYAGLSSIVAELLEKGTSKRNAEKVAEQLGLLGADFDASSSPDFSTISTAALSTDSRALLDIFEEIVLQPAFSDGEVERVRKQILAGIEKRVDSPDAFADMAWDDYLYDTHAYARPVSGTLRSVKAIKRRHVIKHYLHHYRPGNAMMAVIGQWDESLVSEIERRFGGWEARPLPDEPQPAWQGPKDIQIRVVDKPGLAQTQIRIGNKGIRRKNDDFLTLRVANTILGGAFASRLNSRIRKDLGLTYSIYSGFDARADEGAFEISTFTKNESTGQTVTEALAILKTYKEKGVTSEEVAAAKGYMRGVFPTTIETAEKLANSLLLLRRYGVPDSYLGDYLEKLDDISTSDVNRVIKKYFDDRNLKILIYSEAPKVVPQLQSLGIVEVRKASEYP